MFTIKNIISALVIASIVCIVIVCYVVDEHINFRDFQNEYGFLQDPTTKRHILADQHSQKQEPQASDIQHNPNHLAQVKVQGDKTNNSSKDRSSSLQYDSFDDNQIVFAICCPEQEEIHTIQALSNEFILLFHNTAMQPLQTATTHTLIQDQSKPDLLKTKLSTDNIQLTFQHHNVLNVRSSPLLMIYTLHGQHTFIHNLIKQLYLRSNRLEIGITTTIESNTVPQQQGSLLVRWISPRFNTPSVALDSAHINMIMQQVNAAKNMESGIQTQLQRDQLLFNRQQKKQQLLQRERESLDSVLQLASIDTYPRLQESQKTIQASVNHLKIETVLIRHQIESLRHEQTALETMMQNSKHQMDMYRNTWYFNEETVAKLKHELRILHERRLNIIKELQAVVTRFEATAHVVTLYQVYLSAKRKHETWKDAQNIEKRFVKKNESMWECSNYAARSMCGDRVILCRGDEDIFEYDAASIVADIHFKHPAIFKHDYEILVLTNSECNHTVLEDDVEIAASTVHKCTFGDTKCVLQSESAYSTFGKDQALKDICIFVRCNVAQSFDIDAIIAVKFGQKQKQSVLRNKHSVTMHQTITKETSKDSYDATEEKEKENNTTETKGEAANQNASRSE
eukprot:453176_1